MEELQEIDKDLIILTRGDIAAPDFLSVLALKRRQVYSPYIRGKLEPASVVTG